MNYEIATICCSTRYIEEIIKLYNELTERGYIVLADLTDHDRQEEFNKEMIDDMHKAKIDMADEVFVVNPNGYIGESTWSEICYADMIGKNIDSLEPIDANIIKQKVRTHLMFAELYAARQYDVWSHLASDYPADYLLTEMVTVKKGKFTTMDPWVPEDESVPISDHPYIGHADKKSGYDPFKVYGKQKMARFVEEIIIKNKIESEKKPSRIEMMDEIEWYCRELDMPLPKGYPEDMTDEEMRKWIECWHEFDPCPDV